MCKMGTSVSVNFLRLPEVQPLVCTSGYCGIVLRSTLGHVGGGNSCGGHTLMRVAMIHAG